MKMNVKKIIIGFTAAALTSCAVFAQPVTGNVNRVEKTVKVIPDRNVKVEIKKDKTDKKHYGCQCCKKRAGEERKFKNHVQKKGHRRENNRSSLPPKHHEFKKPNNYKK